LDPFLGGGGQGGDGGGIVNAAAASHLRLGDTIVAYNSAGAGGAAYDTNTLPGSEGSNPDLQGIVSSRGFNFIGVADGGEGVTNGINSDLVGALAAPIDPLLGPLDMNGGPTPTHALLTGSPVIAQGNSFGRHSDQRGQRRPFDFMSIPKARRGDGSDIGAFELQPGD
jgi:hypothetical protein